MKAMHSAFESPLKTELKKVPMPLWQWKGNRIRWSSEKATVTGWMAKESTVEMTRQLVTERP